MINVYHQKISDMWFATAIEDEKVRATAFSATERECVQQLLESLPYNQPFTFEAGSSPLAEKVFDALKSMLAGEGVSLGFRFEQNHLSRYAQKVLGCLAKVPVGYVTTYKELARTAGGGPRAVGQIMALNPFAPLVPCHRVIRADFSVGGYGGGTGNVKLKRDLLQSEDKGFEKPSRVKTECGMLELWPVGFLRKK